MTKHDFYLGCDIEAYYLPGEDWFWYIKQYELSSSDHYGTPEDALAAAKEYLRSLP